MNIMLLAMSTYPKEISHCTALFENVEKYSYFSQLEPGCKQFIKRLADKGDKFDKIISLCTEETLTAPSSMGFKKLCLKSDISQLSPYEFFKKRLVGFIRNNDDAFAYEKENGIDVSECSVFENQELYDDVDSLFVDVKVEADELNIESTVTGIIGIIDELPKEENERINLYLNVQGGARKNIQIINTVLNMLKNRNYVLAAANAIAFSGDKIGESACHNMLNVTSTYLKNDLAAALNAFLKYGRGDMFKEYYERYKKESGITKASEGKIISCINRISDSILLCDAADFINGINSLKAEIINYENQSDENKDPFFKLIINDIKDSYRRLFDSTNIIDDLDVLIEWCVERKLLQQALTLLEVISPRFVFRRGLLYAKKDENTEITLKRLKNQKDQSKIPKYKFDNPDYAVINTFCILNVGNEDYKVNIDFVNNRKVLRKLINSEYQFNMVRSADYPDAWIGLYSDIFERCSVNTSADEIEKLLKLVCDFTQMYAKIRDLRNNTNHAGNTSNDSGIEAYLNKIKSDVQKFNKLLKTIKELTIDVTPHEFYSGAEL